LNFFSLSHISWGTTCGFFVHSNRASLFDQSLTSCLSICIYLLILVALRATKFNHTPPPLWPYHMLIYHVNISALIYVGFRVPFRLTDCLHYPLTMAAVLALYWSIRIICCNDGLQQLITWAVFWTYTCLFDRYRA
jgi:energy-coupling factor transporter transmembrane protein EcfT